jgi:hypothetical protein
LGVTATVLVLTAMLGGVAATVREARTKVLAKQLQKTPQKHK